MWQRIKNIYHLFGAFLANLYYGFPSKKLKVIGVTGTSGKTTVTHMIYNVLRSAGLDVSMLSTIQAEIAGKNYDTGFHVTTPNPFVLAKFLNEAVKKGDKYFILEVSSHALDQNRVAFIKFEIGVLTTLAHEHLDYHKTFLNYAKAKFKLLHKAKHAVVPFDIKTEIKNGVGFNRIERKITTFGLTNGDYNQKECGLDLKILGDFNLLNALCAACAANLLRLPKKIIKNALDNFILPPGRFEEIPVKKDFRVFIDFAHKPDALEEILKTGRKEVGDKGRVIVMFGCASQRDVLKRPMMGKISANLADVTVLTDEDPRFEEPIKIINEIAKGCLWAKAKEVRKDDDFGKINGRIFLKIPDRKKAIEFIFKKIVKKGDMVFLCGKGHEKSMNYRGIENPWNERAVVEKALGFGNLFL